MSQFKFYAAAFAIGAAFSVADMSPAFAVPPTGHNDDGCRSKCNPTPPPTPPPAQGGNTNNNDNNATATANGWGYGEANATGGNANAQGGNANAQGGIGQGGEGGNSQLSNTNSFTTNYRAAANGGNIYNAPSGKCGEGFSGGIGVLEAVVSVGVTGQNRPCLAGNAALGTMNVGAQMNDNTIVAVGVQGLAKTYDEIQSGVTQVGAALAANPCAVDAPSAIQLLNPAAAARVQCRPVVAQADASLGQQQTINVNVAEGRTSVARAPLTCPAAQAAERTALDRFTAATAAWTALAVPRRSGTSQETRYLETWREHSNALIDRASACGPQTPGAS